MDVVALHKQFNTQLHSYICNKVNHHDDCHDILQEAYIKIIMNLNKLAKADNIQAYLYKIASNTVTDHYRKKTPCGDCCESATEPMDTDLQGKSLQLADCCLQPFIESLDPLYKEALTFTELNGFTQKQYAAQAGISVSGAKSRVQRARQQLKQRILACCNYQFDAYGNIISCCNK